MQQHPEMASAAATLQSLATALPEVTLPDGVPNPAAVQARLEAGIPALEGEPLLRGHELIVGIQALLTALGAAAPPLAWTLDRSMSEADANELAAVSQAGTWDSIGDWVARSGCEANAIVMLADYAARPFLRAGARAVHEAIARMHWNRGTCPACGAAPLLGELRSGGSSGAERERVLRCGRCLTAWPFPRLRCARCGETDHERLSYLHGPGEEAYRRAEVCSSCRSYLKTIAVLAPLSLIEMTNADLATAALDLGAMELGFHK
jgi:formate dehydrogenase accessory protein FdhE